MAEETERKTWRNFYIILILVLLGANAWLFYNAYQNKEDRKKLEQRISEAGSLNDQLNVKIDSLYSDLQNQKGENEQKDSLINVLQNDLQNRRNQISSLISGQNLISKQSDEVKKLLDEAKQEIAQLENAKIAYQSRIDSMTVAYKALQENYEALEIQYGNEIVRGDKLTVQKDSIQQLGQVISASNLTVTGVRTKGKGKEVEDQSAKKTERLKICFDLLKNRLSAGQKQTIFIKVIDPNGLTLYDTTQGSDEFTDMDNNEQSKYTASVTVDYEGKASENYCFYWNQPDGFLPGDYKVLLYHNGYFIGENGFSLKKSIF